MHSAFLNSVLVCGWHLGTITRFSAGGGILEHGIILGSMYGDVLSRRVVYIYTLEMQLSAAMEGRVWRSVVLHIIDAQHACYHMPCCPPFS